MGPLSSRRPPRPAPALGRLLVLLVALGPAPLPAHNSPDHNAEAVTARLAREGRSAALLCERAHHYRELGRLADAEADLAAACELAPGDLDAANQLARVQFQRGDTTRARQTLDRALPRARSAGERAPLWLTRAEVRAAAQDYAAALADCEQAFAASDPDLDWFLLRAQLQLRAGRPADAAAGLRRGFEETGNAVLEAEWIEALIDAGQATEALGRIEGPLAASRWRSSWLLRRARARLALGDRVRARGDLHEAVRELDSRLVATRPDPSLLLDRGLARALLGDRTAARADLDQARRSGAEAAATWRLESELAATR
ncbi:MAG: hypothetical protein RJA22_1189 [Verrucomicrobiota bacterium]